MKSHEFPVKAQLEWYFSDDVQALTRIGVDCLFHDSQTARRIRNAVTLIGLGDSQPHAGLSLSLYVAAIEAIVSTKSTDAQDQFCIHLGVLLQYEGELGPNDNEGLRKLYDARSKCLHGSDLVPNSKFLPAARLLAAAALRAVLEWGRENEKLLRKKQSGMFMQQLKESATAGLTLQGVSSDLSEELRYCCDVFYSDRLSGLEADAD